MSSRITNASPYCPPAATPTGNAAKNGRTLSTRSNGARGSAAGTRGMAKLPGNVPPGRSKKLASSGNIKRRGRTALPAVSRGIAASVEGTRVEPVAPIALYVQQPADGDSSIPALEAPNELNPSADDVTREYLNKQFAAALR